MSNLINLFGQIITKAILHAEQADDDKGCTVERSDSKHAVRITYSMCDAPMFIDVYVIEGDIVIESGRTNREEEDDINFSSSRGTAQNTIPAYLWPTTSTPIATEYTTPEFNLDVFIEDSINHVLDGIEEVGYQMGVNHVEEISKQALREHESGRINMGTYIACRKVVNGLRMVMAKYLMDADWRTTLSGIRTITV